MDGEGLQPRFCCFRFDMAKTRCKRRGSSFYLPEDTFDGIPIPAYHHLESMAIFIENIDQIIGLNDEEFDAIELVTSMQIGQKPPRRLFRRR